MWSYNKINLKKLVKWTISNNKFHNNNNNKNNLKMKWNQEEDILIMKTCMTKTSTKSKCKRFSPNRINQNHNNNNSSNRSSSNNNNLYN